ncbi:MAG: sigma-54-dependent Fis family transcriptional regulator [Peptostreptococcaceae bacterium]|nr:sigma-54-dependent Fis family transcriptional regulator [Peptostreptococcaceae bacterium]
MYRVLVADDEKYIRWIISKTINDDCEVIEAANGKECLEKFEAEEPDLVVLDLRMPGMDGMKVLEVIHEKDRDLPVIMITAHGTIETAIEAMKHGAYDFVTKPFDIDELKIKIYRAIRMKSLLKEVSYHRTEISKTIEGYFVETKSQAMADVYELIDMVSKSDSNVFITGESGTGKEVVARMIHDKSARRHKPMVTVNCAAIPETLIESELFGHEKGAFTGAIKTKPGKFELASGGTLFLDEIAETSLSIQVKLLRTVQEKSIERVGGIRTIETDIRLITATNKNIEDAVKFGEFREDLYYRLNVVQIRLPSLKERKQDIPLLARHLLDQKKRKTEPASISEAAMEALISYNWPGNIRELENCIERALIVSKNGEILPKHLPFKAPYAPNIPMKTPLDFPEEGIDLEETEKCFIRAALKQSGGNRTKAAKLLSITRSALLYRMNKYGIS